MNTHEGESQSGRPAPVRLPEAPIDRWMRPLAHFLHVESASGVLLLIGTVVALAIANSPWSASFAAFWQVHARIGVGSRELDESLGHWINDGLMTIFFFVVGLEIKREVVAGELRDPKQAALPVMAALGGMLAPAAIYWLLRGGQVGSSGWGVPMATDIAFVVGFLALLGPRVPLGLKVLLLSLAIADDMGAVLVIAVFYSHGLWLGMLGWAAAGFAAVWLLNRVGVRSVPVYVLIAVGIWLAFLKSGVHPTVAGVLLGLLTPAEAWITNRALADLASDLIRRLRGGPGDVGAEGHVEVGHPSVEHPTGSLEQLSLAAREAVSPLERLEAALHPWVAFGIMPLFALANAGVRIDLAMLGHPVAVAVAAGLVLGKPLGIVLFSWLAVRVGLARMPDGMNWKILCGGGCLAGIGFTMSLFIASLALDPALLDAGKIGTLCGSFVSALAGLALLLAFLPKASQVTAASDGEGEPAREVSQVT